MPACAQHLSYACSYCIELRRHFVSTGTVSCHYAYLTALNAPTVMLTALSSTMIRVTWMSVSYHATQLYSLATN